MLARQDIDIVVVCTPHSRHTEYVVAAAEAGKHVIVEKPMALTWVDTKRQLAAAKRAGIKTLVSYVLHWNPLLMTIDRLIEQGAFGHIFLVEVDYMHRIWMGPEEKWYGSRDLSGASADTLTSVPCTAISRKDASLFTAVQLRLIGESFCHLDTGLADRAFASRQRAFQTIRLGRFFSLEVHRRGTRGTHVNSRLRC